MKNATLFAIAIAFSAAPAAAQVNMQYNGQVSEQYSGQYSGQSNGQVNEQVDGRGDKSQSSGDSPKQVAPVDRSGAGVNDAQSMDAVDRPLVQQR